jgi:hypothetical protein
MMEAYTLTYLTAIVMAASSDAMNEGDIDYQAINEEMAQIQQHHDGLKIVFSSFNADKRLLYAIHLIDIAEQSDDTDPKRIAKAIEMFQVCVRNIQLLQPNVQIRGPLSSSARRKLFLYRQSALNELVSCCKTCPHKTTADINGEELE